MTKELKLNQDQVALVDDEDFELVNQYHWCANCSHRKTYYAEANVKLPSKYSYKILRMHRLITGAVQGQRVDHKNGNGLDNRRDNLRVATKSQNAANGEMHSNNTTGYKGVYQEKIYGWYQAFITVNYKHIFLGQFVTAKEAARAYNDAALEYFGEFARLNEVKEAE